MLMPLMIPMYGFYDSSYMIVMLVGAALVFIPQMMVQNTFKKYDEVPTARGRTGAQVAQEILAQEGIRDVSVEMTPGFLSDHYDPSSKTVRLSEGNYHGSSVAGVAVAAHEVGHAIQHAKGYYPVVIRSALVPVVNIGSQMGPLMLMIALGLGVTGHIIPGWAYLLAWVGVILFGMSVLFHIVTLPVELNASARALAIVGNGRFLTETELPGAKKVLFAAAMTYVAAAMYALIQLLYYIMRIMGSRRE